mmetsp:Transcript_68739/g.80119  ORF Transcript_68739/g.80119 Transcript_68739/m.80119 type:complete len:401 (+) Transcript_68739:72-1274(+)
MISVLNINPEPIQKETYTQLEQMGFSANLIQQAHSKSEDKTVSGLLNWLLEHQDDVKTDSKATTSQVSKELSNNAFVGSKKKNKNNRKHKNSDYDEDEILRKISADVADELSGLSNKFISSKSKKKSQPNEDASQKLLPKITSPQSCPIRPQKLSTAALAEIKKIIGDLEIGNSINSHEITKCVNDLFKKWKYSKSDVDAEIMFGLSFEDLKDETLLGLRSKLYQLVDKVFNMRIRKDAILDFSSIETMLMNSHDLGCFNKSQTEKIKVSYIKFCRKMKVAENDMLIAQLESASGGTGRKALNKFNLNSPENKPESLGDLPKASKLRLSDDEDSDEKTPEDGDQLSLSEKELCVICMDRIREVVYMPCAHFLTCPLCSPCLKDCPICTKKVEKYLKIYWC